MSWKVHALAAVAFFSAGFSVLMFVQLHDWVNGITWAALSLSFALQALTLHNRRDRES